MRTLDKYVIPCKKYDEKNCSLAPITVAVSIVTISISISWWVSVKSTIISISISIRGSFGIPFTQVVTIVGHIAFGQGISWVSNDRVGSDGSFIIWGMGGGIGLRLCHNSGNSESYEQQ